MTIKEVEQITGLTRSNIRFYEKEKLICPNRNTENGYREYSKEDIQNIQKIAYLRTLGISVEDIRRISCKQADLYDVVKAQRRNLDKQLSELENARVMCDRMLSSAGKIDYENLEVAQYVNNAKEYWSENRNVFKLDSIGFFHMWRENITWGILTVSCMLIAVFSFGYLPADIPMQWDGDAVSFVVDKNFIFAFPVACLIIKFGLRPFLWRWLQKNIVESDSITDYITNYLCLIVLSVEIFIILYVNEFVSHITVILFIDTFVLIGLLLIAICKSMRREDPAK